MHLSDSGLALLIPERSALPPVCAVRWRQEESETQRIVNKTIITEVDVRLRTFVVFARRSDQEGYGFAGRVTGWVCS